MSVKIIHQPESGGDGSPGRREPAEAAAAPGQEMGRGAMFLASKQRELADSNMIDEQARDTANWLAEQLASVVNDSFVRLRPTAGLALKAAHLVKRSRLDEYRERLRSAREERPELLFLTSGPWPPYSFCDLTTRSDDQ